MSISLVIPAGGASTRFYKGIPKKETNAKSSKLLFMLSGKPLLYHTIQSFQKIPQISETIVAVPRGTEVQMKNWSAKQGWKKVRWVVGGRTRAESVWNALKKSKKTNSFVMVHDGARPLIEEKTISKLVALTKNSKLEAAILARPVVPTLKKIKRSRKEIEQTIDRSGLFEAETPQLMKRKVLEQAYKNNKKAFDATDESSLLELMDIPVKIVAHAGWNPKITNYDDLLLAEAFLQQKYPSETRTGFGRDIHRLVKGRKLWIGGVHVPFTKGALGHSDGDVLLHSITDAILGVLGEGDIGDHFSDKDPRHKNIQSSKIVKNIMALGLEKGWKVTHVDSVITLEKPKLGELKMRIKKNVAKLLNMDEKNVSIKAKTQEGLGPEGKGEALSCEALVTMRKGLK